MKGLQKRHYDYVLGPNQDSRLASVAAGDIITEVLLNTDDDAPFVLTGRAVRCDYSEHTSPGDQRSLVGLKTKWTGPTRDYRQQGFLLESLQMAYYGQFGNPKPIIPGVHYPARSVLMLDLINTGPDIANLTFFFRGFKLYPPDTVPAYTYPRRLASQTFSYPVPVTALGASETRLNQIFTCKTDADFVLRAGQGPIPRITDERLGPLLNVSIRLKDFNKLPYSSDFMPFDVLFGCGDFPAVVPVGSSPDLVAPFSTGPSSPGIFYPEIYLPMNHQLLYDLQRSDTVLNSAVDSDFAFNFIGGKVFHK